MGMKKGISGRGVAVRAAAVPRAQRCSVKVSFSKNAKSWKAHANYLQRDGAQRDEGKGMSFGQVPLFGGGYEFKHELNASDEVSRWTREDDSVLFKAILSPEHGDKASLRDFAQAFVAKVEKDLKTRLEWFAIEHYNTDRPHVHLCIRGRTEQGADLTISPHYIRNGLRSRASEVLTTLIGYRSEQDIVASRKREVGALAWTGLDAELAQRQQKDGQVDLSKEPRVREGRERFLAYQQLVARMRQLEAWGLAEKLARRQWALKHYAQRALQEHVRARDRTKKVLAGEAFVSDPRAGLAAGTLGHEREWAAGRVLGCDKDSSTGVPFLLLEGLDGRIHFIDGVAAKAKPGTTVWLESRAGQVFVEELPEHSPALVERYLAKSRDALPALTGRDDGYADRFARAVYTYQQERRREAGLAPLPDYTHLKNEAQAARQRSREDFGALI